MIKNNKPLFILLVSIGSFFVIGIIVTIFFLVQANTKQPGTISIKNFDSVVKNLPQSERVELEKALYNTVSSNISSDQKIDEIDDALIRETSYYQNLDEKIYTTDFIVDIQSIKQSYKIKSLYSQLSREESSLFDYTALALCLEKSELIYGEFTCKDRLSQEAGVESSDPILQYLPLSTLDYTISYDISSKDLKLTAKLNLSEIDYRLGEEAAITQYKNNIKDWFESKNLDINNYAITYEY